MEGGFLPPTVGSFFFIFRLENVQSGAYLRRKFRFDDMYYIIITCMELKISHGIIEGEGLRGSEATKPEGALRPSGGGGGCGRGVSPSHGRELLHFLA